MKENDNMCQGPSAIFLRYDGSSCAIDNQILNGKPIIRGMRISVELILELLAKGSSEKEILEDYPLLEPEDIRAAHYYAHHMVAREQIFDRPAA